MNNVLIRQVEELEKGFLHVCDAVSETLGAEGKLAVLEHPDPTMPPTITKDGVSVANHIRFADKVQNFGAFLARMVAAKTLEKSGDSTTTSLVFSKAFLRNFKDKSKYNKAVERGLNAGYNEVVEKLTSISKPTDTDSIERIAVVSANNDEELGKLIIKSYNSVGTHGIVEVRKNKGTNETKLDVFKGMKIEKGYHSPFFINNNEAVSWEAEDVLVAVCESWISDENIKNFIKDNRYIDGDSDKGLQPLLLVMEKVEDLNFVMDLERFAQRNLYNICMISTPDVEKFRKVTHLQDIALYTGAEIYQPSDEAKNIVAGKASSVIINSETTSIIQKETDVKVEETVEMLKRQLPTTKDADFLKKRIQRLEGVSCIISVGGFTDSEIDERYDRVDDALKSVKSSIELGWIPGGGSALVHISGTMNRKFSSKDEQMGYELIKKVIQEPFLQIIRNANRRQSDNYFERLIFGGKNYRKHSLKELGVGYNAKTDMISNLIDDGVIDSTKSILVAFQNSKSVAEKLLNVGVVVSFTN